MSETNDDGKFLRVVFQRKNVFREDDFDYQYLRKAKIDPRTSKAVREVTKKVMQMKLEAMRGDFDKKHCDKKAPISQIIEAIKDSSAQEDLAMDKFVHTVESMMTRFKSDLDKLEKIYSNVLKNLPKMETN